MSNAERKVESVPPCRALLREVLNCEGCGKQLTRKTLMYKQERYPLDARREDYDRTLRDRRVQEEPLHAQRQRTIASPAPRR